MVTPTGLKGMTRGLGLALVAAVLAGTLAPTASAAPFLYTWLEARVGSSGPYTTGPLAVLSGQVIEYRIWTEIAAPVGQYNSATNKNLTSLAPITNGISGLKFNLYETATDPIQVNFAAPTTLNAAAGWTAGAAGVSGGTVQARAGSPGQSDLVIIRPLQAVGVFAGVPGSSPVAVLVATGTAVATGDSLTTDSFLKMSGKYPNSQTTRTTMKINSTVSVTEGNTAAYDTDPITIYGPVGSPKEYAGLILYTPWADAMQQGVDPVTGYVVDLMKNEDLHLMAAVGGSGHTNLEYKWTIMSPEIIVYGRDVIVPSALLATLPGEHHIVRLDVSGDGQSDSMEVPLALVPEPATMALLALGGLAVASVRRRRIR